MTAVRIDVLVEPEHKPALLPLDAGEQYRFVFDMGACIGCHSCEVACAEQNGLPADVVWRRVGELEAGDFPDTRRFNLSMACNHCLEPTCLTGCPTEAYVKLPNGVVDHHADDCIGCQYCTWNCPYSVPVYWSDRKVVSKCDMCLPRLSEGRSSACVEACPTHAIGIEKVDVAAWREEHSAADGPGLPPSDISLSTTRLILPPNASGDEIGGADHDLRPEDPHWPLVALTLLTQLAVGTAASAVAVQADGHPASRAALVAAVTSMLALAASLFHLGRPAVAWKALRNLRRSWLSREVALFGAYAAVGVAHAGLSLAEAGGAVGVGIAAAAVGAAGVYASGRLYLVPARPAWNSPLTLVHFFATGVALGPLAASLALPGSAAAGLRPIALAGLCVQLAVLAANTARLASRPEREWRGSAVLLTHRFRGLLAVRIVTLLAAVLLVAVGAPVLLPLVAACVGELVGRYLFYVTVVPRNIAGSFTRRAA